MNLELVAMLPIMSEQKPSYGDKCNRCGYCCAVEVCAMGKAMGGGSVAPCNHLRYDDATKESSCFLITQVGESSQTAKDLGIGTGCDAMNHQEAIAAYEAKIA